MLLSLENLFWRRYEGYLWNPLIAALVALAAYAAVRMRWIRPTSVIACAANSGRARAIAVLAVMLLPVGFRLAFLPWAGVPQPHFADEYGHLLVADTLAHGRLANPPHPLWRHLDTFYVLQHPAYAAQYPLGQGIMLATGKVLAGNPWVGVLLVTALMGGATCWALFDILPLRWAALAALLAGFAYGFHWINSYSYWGGQFCAFGGALLFGALVRLWRTRAGVSPSKLPATVAALGWCIIWLLRPFESVVPFLLFWSVLA